MDFMGFTFSHLPLFSPACLAMLTFSFLVYCWCSYGYGSSTLSWIINAYLTRIHRIRSVDRGIDIPTCPYVWPNGQGDVAKFLQGEENGKIWGQKHGAMYRIWSGMNPEIVLTDPVQIKAAFADSDKHSKAIGNNSGWLMEELLGKCVGLISGENWRRVREITATHFSHMHTVSHIPRMTDITENYIRELEKGESLRAKRLHPVEDLKFLPFWVVADILYGNLTPQMTEELKSLTNLRETIWTRMIQGGITRFSWARLLPTETNRKLNDFKQRWAAFNRAACEACRLSCQKKPIVDMYEAVEQGRMSTDELVQTLDEMLFANLDVTVGAISWNLLFLASDLNVQDGIRKETSLAFESGRDGMLQYLLNPSTLLAASVLESARLRPLAPFTVAQSAMTARRIGDFLVPSGTNLIVDTYKLNLQNPVWGEDRQMYNPARFLKKRKDNLRYHYWRFGFGPRQCIGKYVADLTIKILIVHLLRDYQLSIVDETHWVRNPSTWITHPDTVIGCHEIRNLAG